MALFIDMLTTFIYALKDPETGEIRYVGKANNPKNRLLGHLSRKEKNRKSNWIKSLRGLKPTLEILDEVPVLEWPMWEVAYIQFFKDAGFELVNGTMGGDGLSNPSEEVRKKIGDSNRLNLKNNPETRIRMSLASRGRKQSFSQREKISAALKGRVPSTEHRKRLSVALLGKTVSEETRNKIRAARARQRMPLWTPERREKIQKTWEIKKTFRVCPNL